MSKGSQSRPIPDREKFESNWDLIFKKASQAETQLENDDGKIQSDRRLEDKQSD